MEKNGMKHCINPREILGRPPENTKRNPGKISQRNL